MFSGYSHDFVMTHLENDTPLSNAKNLSPPTILRRGHRGRRRSISECEDLTSEHLMPDFYSVRKSDMRQ